MTEKDPKCRTEQEIFDELAGVCRTPGFAHAIAAFCFRDNVVKYADALKGEDYVKLTSPDRLIRTEMSTLIGLMARSAIDWKTPNANELAELLERSENLLKELHVTLNQPFIEEFKAKINEPDANPFTAAQVMREPIFYAAESAYSFQHRDLAPKKYAADDTWFKEHKGFEIEEARKVVVAILDLLHTKLPEAIQSLKGKPVDEWTALAGFQFTIADIIAGSQLPKVTVKSIIDAFTFEEGANEGFTSLDAFNSTNAYPIIKSENETYTLFQYSALTEALYDTPFYWMGEDKKYVQTAMANRGKFAEEFSAERLERVFGEARIFRNVDIWKSRNEKFGEIDVLVMFADRALVLQAKSKKLTLAARKGNDNQLQADFKAAVQDACDQAIRCSQEIIDGKLRVTDAKGAELALPKAIKQVLPICVVSDHYPALAFQTQQFLKFAATEKISTPLICDVFALDVITEFLDTPLRCVSYLDLRARAGSKLLVSHELAALGYHLKHNLWFGDYNMMQLHDDFTADVNVAMLARREGIEAERTPPGILTFLEGKSLGRIIDSVSQAGTPWSTALGLELLKLDGDTATDVSAVIDRMAEQAASIGKESSSSFAFGHPVSGITIQCSDKDMLLAAKQLMRHCEMRKYAQKASTWHGLLVSPGTGAYRHAVAVDYPWQQDASLEKASEGLEALKSTRATGRFKRELKRYREGKAKN